MSPVELDMLDRICEAGGSLTTTPRALAAELGYSIESVRPRRRRLSARGLITIECADPERGTAATETYTVTVLGRRALAIYMMQALAAASGYQTVVRLPDRERRIVEGPVERTRSNQSAVIAYLIDLAVGLDGPGGAG